MGKSQEQQIFEHFATAYPHEAYRAWPGRFLRFAKQKTGRTKKVIVETLKRTEGKEAGAMTFKVWR